MKFFEKLKRYDIFKNGNMNTFMSIEMVDLNNSKINNVETPVKQPLIKENIFYLTNKNVIFIENLIFSAFISSPLSGIYWYTTWYIIEENLNTNIIINLALYTIGFFILALFYIFQNKFEQMYKYQENLDYCEKFSNFILRNSYNYLVCLAIVLEWHGLWNILDNSLIDGKTKFIVSIIAITYLILTRSTRLLITSPYLLAVDAKENCFEYVLKSVIIIL